MLNGAITKSTVYLQDKQENVEHFSNREEPKTLEMTNVVKSLTSFLNPHNDQCYQLELISTCFFLQTPKGPLLGDTK